MSNLRLELINFYSVERKQGSSHDIIYNIDNIFFSFFSGYYNNIKTMTDKSPKNKDKKKKIIYTTLVIVLIFFLFGIFQYFKFTKVRKARSAVIETQRQIMIDSWTEEGLSDEEIEIKLQEMSPRNNLGKSGSPNPFNMIRRVITGKGQGGGFH